MLSRLLRFFSFPYSFSSFFLFSLFFFSIAISFFLFFFCPLEPIPGPSNLWRVSPHLPVPERVYRGLGNKKRSSKPSFVTSPPGMNVSETTRVAICYSLAPLSARSYAHSLRWRARLFAHSLTCSPTHSIVEKWRRYDRYGRIHPTVRASPPVASYLGST